MLTYELVKYENGKYIYRFYPDIDKSAYGVISISDDGEREVIKDSSADVKRYYAGHALWGTVAWC